jgi:hypothetical protein
VARYCANCGHELREGGIFCMACGTPVGGAATHPHASQPSQPPQPPQPPPNWEYCEIREFKAQVGGWFGSDIYTLTAVAFGPNGRYTAGEVSYEGGIGSEQRSAQELMRLIMQLIDDGWQPLPPQPQDRLSDAWRSFRFRRLVRS